MAQMLMMAIAVLYALLRTGHLSREREDPVLGVILLAAVLVRIATGLVNHHMGPLPGAQIDAVMFDETARAMASVPGSTAGFALELGKYGYSSILAVVYLIAGYHYLIPTIVNVVFVVEFLIIVDTICRKWGGQEAARLATAAAAFYPTSILYTAVPLREAPLLFAFALFIRSLIGYYERDHGLIHWRTALSLAFLVWLHDGFALAVFLIPIAVWFRHDKISVLRRLVVGVVGVAAVVATFAMAVTFLDMSKMPEDPSLLLDPAFLARMREVKSAYGEGYGAFAPTWKGILTTAPLLLFAFVAAPFPIWWSGAGELPKVVEGVLSLSIVTTAIALVLVYARGDRRIKMFLAMYLYMVFVFAMGTGNTGIAARHRAKFVWMPIVLCSALWATRVRQPSRSGRDEYAEPPDRLGVETDKGAAA